MIRILLVDDDQALLGGLARALRPYTNIALTTARDGREAERILASGEYDCLVTDLMMPEHDGIELILSLRRSHRPIPIVAMSGGARLLETDILAQARLLGAHAMLEKPFGPEQLVAAIHEALLAAAPDAPHGAGGKQ